MGDSGEVYENLSHFSFGYDYLPEFQVPILADYRLHLLDLLSCW